MRKIYSILTLALLLLASTACTDDKDKDKTITTFQGQLLNNVVNISEGQSEKVSLTTVTIEWNYIDGTISMNYAVPLNEGNTANINFNDAKLNYDSNLDCYIFQPTNAGNSVTNFNGYFNPNKGIIHIEFIVNGTRFVSSNADLFFPYSTFKITNTELENPTPTEYNNAIVAIIVNPSDMSAQLGMGGFALPNSTGEISAVYFSGLKAIATGNGYKGTLDTNKLSNDGSLTLNNFEAIVTANGRVINATFTMNGKFSAIVTGTQFAM